MFSDRGAGDMMVTRVISDFVPPNLRRSLVAVFDARSGDGRRSRHRLPHPDVARTRIRAHGSYGLFASSVVTVTMIAPLAGFGLTQFRLKVYGVEGWAAHRWIKPSLRFIVFTTLLARPSSWRGRSPARRTTAPGSRLLVLTPVVLSTLASDLVGSKLRLEDRYLSWRCGSCCAREPVRRRGSRCLLVPHLTHRFVAVGYGVIALLVGLRAFRRCRRCCATRLH